MDFSWRWSLPSSIRLLIYLMVTIHIHLDPPPLRGPCAQDRIPTQPLLTQLRPGVPSCVAFTSQNHEPPPLLGPTVLPSSAALFYATNKQCEVPCSAFSAPVWDVSLTLGFILRTKLILFMVPFNAMDRYYTEQIVCQLESKCELDRQQGRSLNLNSRTSIVTAPASPEAT